MPAARGVKFRCPVCKCKIDPTMRRNIPGHLDGKGDACRAVGQPFEIALREFGR